MLALLTAVATGAFIFYYRIDLATFHQEAVGFLLSHIGIPVAGLAHISMPGGLDVPTPLVAVAGYTDRSTLMAVTGIAASVVGLALFFLFRVSRMLLGLMLVLLAASYLNVLLGGQFGSDATAFSALWIRFEIVIWFFVPFLMALFAGIVIPDVPRTIFWIVAPTIYAIVWSVIRLTFCLGVLQLTGPLLAPVLWFLMGSLADVLYISTFYSFVAWHAGSIRSGSGSE